MRDGARDSIPLLGFTVVTKNPFLGFPLYLDRAATELTHPEMSIPARRITPLAAIANLCAQASTADDASASCIFGKADELRHQLHVAALAADMMLDDTFVSKPLSQAPSDASKGRSKSNRSTNRF